MNKLRKSLIQGLEKIKGLEDRPSKVAGGSAIFYRDKEIAHFHNDNEIDVRLSKKLIKQNNLSHPNDSEFHKNRGASSEWIELRFTNKKEVDQVVNLFQILIQELGKKK